MKLDGRIGAVLRGALWVVVALAAVWLWHAVTGRIDLRPPDEADPAAALELIDTQGARIDLASFRGRVVLLNLFASWCGPCRREIPTLAALHREHADRGLVVLGLNVDDVPRDRVPEIARRLGIPYPVVVAGSPMVGPFEPPGVIPHTWLIDREGRVRASHSGFATAASFERACRTLLREPQPPGGRDFASGVGSDVRTGDATGRTPADRP